jgi:hypothetical protein
VTRRFRWSLGFIVRVLPSVRTEAPSSALPRRGRRMSDDLIERLRAQGDDLSLDAAERATAAPGSSRSGRGVYRPATHHARARRRTRGPWRARSDRTLVQSACNQLCGKGPTPSDSEVTPETVKSLVDGSIRHAADTIRQQENPVESGSKTGGRGFESPLSHTSRPATQDLISPVSSPPRVTLHVRIQQESNVAPQTPARRHYWERCTASR